MRHRGMEDIMFRVPFSTRIVQSLSLYVPGALPTSGRFDQCGQRNLSERTFYLRPSRAIVSDKAALPKRSVIC